MRKISGKLLSSKPISLPLAAKRLSSFAALENGASAAVSIYLQRAADAFNNLVHFHTQNKPFKHHVKKEYQEDEKPINIQINDVEKKKKRKKKNKSDDLKVVKIKKEELDTENVEKITKEVNREVLNLAEKNDAKQEKKSKSKKKKKKKKKKKTSDDVGLNVQVKKEQD